MAIRVQKDSMAIKLINKAKSVFFFRAKKPVSMNQTILQIQKHVVPRVGWNC